MTNKVKYLFLTILPLMTLAFTSCGPNGNNFDIEGKVKNFQDGEIYIYSNDDNYARFDTLQVKHGSFSYQGKADKPTPYYIVFQNAMEQVIFVDAGKSLKYEASANDMKNYVVKGSKENELLNEFRKTTAKMAPVKTKAEAKDFIKENVSSPVAIYLLDRYFVQDKNSDPDEIIEIAELLKKDNPKDIFLIELITNIKAMKTCSVGTKLPNVKLTTKTGRNVDLAKPTKKFTLLAFWATWMNDEWDLRPTLRDIYNDNSDNLDIVAVSLDTQIFRWEEEVKPDSATISHVCDGKAWDSPAVKALAIRNIPTFIFADNNAKIIEIAKSLQQLKSTITKTIKEP